MVSLQAGEKTETADKISKIDIQQFLLFTTTLLARVFR